MAYPTKPRQSLSTFKCRVLKYIKAYAHLPSLNCCSCLCKKYCKFGNFREGFISRNFAYAKFRENKILTNGRNHSVVY